MIGNLLRFRLDVLPCEFITQDMAKRTETPRPIPPTISMDEGKRRLEHMRDKAKSLISGGRVSDEAAEMWANTTMDYIKQTFGSDTPHKYTFLGEQQIRIVGSGGYNAQAYEVQNAKETQRRIQVLDELLGLIQMEMGFSSKADTQSQQFDFWSLLHPDVVQYSKSRYDAGHFADSVEAAFKHVNTKVKDLVFRKIGKEHDGASLMRTAFSPNNPVISLDDLSTESGKNIQQGYMDIFAGSMTGVRNPKAHGNIRIDPKRAIHLLFLASLLLYRLDDRL